MVNVNDDDDGDDDVNDKEEDSGVDEAKYKSGV